MSSNDFSFHIRNLGDEIANLQAKELPELAAYLRETHNLLMSFGLGPCGIDESPAPQAQYPFSVILDSYEDRHDGYSKKISVIKAVRSITGIGLKEAKDLVESLPQTIKTQLERVDAELIKRQLEEAGGQAHIQ